MCKNLPPDKLGVAGGRVEICKPGEQIELTISGVKEGNFYQNQVIKLQGSFRMFFFNEKRQLSPFSKMPKLINTKLREVFCRC